MDLRHIVTVDHANIRQLIEQLLRSPTAGGATGRDNLFEQLDNEVRRHLKLMKKVIMPAMQDAGGATTSRDPRTASKNLKQMLDDLYTGDKSSEEWTSRFQSFSDELDRVFGEHTQMIATLDARSDSDEIAREYERQKAKLIRSGGYVSRWGGNGGRVAGIGIGLAVAAVAGAMLWRRRSQARGSDIIPTQRRLSPPTTYGRTGTGTGTGTGTTTRTTSTTATQLH
jgi:hypothetical protein